jgi:hypothetical protein
LTLLLAQVPCAILSADGFLTCFIYLVTIQWILASLSVSSSVDLWLLYETMVQIFNSAWREFIFCDWAGKVPGKCWNEYSKV